MKLFNIKKYLSFATIAGFALPMFIIFGFDNYFNNWDSSDVENFIRQNKLGGVFYLDSARPFFIQRSAQQGSSFFYDLNPRNSFKYDRLRDCLQPDYWIVKSHGRSKTEFQKIKKLFKLILVDKEDIFLAKNLAPGLQEVSKPICKGLSMIG